MSRMVFVNLPVKNLPMSIDFFTELGFEFNPNFTDENATCMILSETNFVMLLSEPFFGTFTPKPVADAAESTEVLIGLSASSRAEVDQIVNAALDAGAVRYKEPDDQGFMYGWGFQDLDGHLWELIYMDPAAVDG